MIGFLQNYTVTEGVDNMAVVEIGVLSGQLAIPVRVRVFTMDVSAKSN